MTTLRAALADVYERAAEIVEQLPQGACACIDDAVEVVYHLPETVIAEFPFDPVPSYLSRTIFQDYCINTFRALMNPQTSCIYWWHSPLAGYERPCTERILGLLLAAQYVRDRKNPLPIDFRRWA